MRGLAQGTAPNFTKLYQNYAATVMPTSRPILPRGRRNWWWWYANYIPNHKTCALNKIITKSRFSVRTKAKYSQKRESGEELAWENSRRFTRSPLEPSQNDVWVTSAEIPYWWRALPRLVVLLIGWKKIPSQHNQSDWVVIRHQYGISALVTQTSICQGSSGDLAKRRLLRSRNKPTKKSFNFRFSSVAHERLCLSYLFFFLFFFNISCNTLISRVFSSFSVSSLVSTCWSYLVYLEGWNQVTERIYIVEFFSSATMLDSFLSFEWSHFLIISQFQQRPPHPPGH